MARVYRYWFHHQSILSGHRYGGQPIAIRVAQCNLRYHTLLSYSDVVLTAPELLLMVSSVAIIVVATPPVAGTGPLLGAIGYLVQRVYFRTSRQVRLMDLEAKGPLCTHFLESLTGIVTIRAFGWSAAYRKKNSVLLDQSQVPFYLHFAIQSWLNLVLEL
jgi:ABC-type multidrug transport system fused ATPase/permease subunit